MSRSGGSRRQASAEDTAADIRRIERYLEGDPAASREVDSWIQSEIGACYPILRGESEDLGQAVHAKLLEKLRAGRFEHRSTLRTYIAGIVHHTSINRIRKLYRERTPPEGWEDRATDGAPTPYQSLAAVQEKQLLHRVVQRSPAPCRAMWRMIFIERLSYAEIGRRLSIPPGTVKSRMWHCRRKALALLTRLRRATAHPPITPRRGSRDH